MQFLAVATTFITADSSRELAIIMYYDKRDLVEKKKKMIDALLVLVKSPPPTEI